MGNRRAQQSSDGDSALYRFRYSSEFCCFDWKMQWRHQFIEAQKKARLERETEGHCAYILMRKTAWVKYKAQKNNEKLRPGIHM